LAPAATTQALDFDWERKVAGESEWIALLAAAPTGVLVAGGETHRHGESRPFVASFDRLGRRRFRVRLQEPKATTSPQRAAAQAIAVAPSGDAYVVATASGKDARVATSLVLLDAAGHVRFTTPLELFFTSSLVVDADGGVIAAGRGPTRDGVKLVKFARDGTRVWTKAYPYAWGTPRLVRLPAGLALVGTLRGTAEFGETCLARNEQVEYRCADDEHPCEDGASGLVVAVLDAAGEPLHAHLFGSPASRLVFSDASVTAAGHLLITGEYSGPPAALGNVTLCELEPGMPELDRSGFHEAGRGPRCDCRSDRRDLFALELDAQAEPLWATTLALGAPTPGLASGPGGEIRWAAQVWHEPRPGDQGSKRSTHLELWTLQAGGTVGLRRATRSGLDSPREMVENDGAIYFCDERTLRKTSF
jgi:hypothetical protein